MLVKSFVTNNYVKLTDNSQMSKYFHIDKYGKMLANQYGISVQGNIIPYANIIAFEPAILEEFIPEDDSHIEHELGFGETFVSETNRSSKKSRKKKSDLM